MVVDADVGFGIGLAALDEQGRGLFAAFVAAGGLSRFEGLARDWRDGLNWLPPEAVISAAVS